jgi:hypothetical protein
MAKKTARGRKQDRARVAGKQASHGAKAETLDGIRIGKSQDGLRFLRSKGKAPGHP